ncbi:hypothetical protein OAG19_02900, partial [Akkermansiaceae bacterium]|nr:hypothetical protein [Akkermansiaceae bacterium]
MKAFVFNPTDKNIGKFKLKSLNEIEAATKDFIQKSGDVPDFSYIQVGLDTWTISSTTPFTLLAGRLTYDSIVRAEAEVEAHNRHFDALLEKCLASGQDERGLSSLSWKDLQEVV